MSGSQLRVAAMHIVIALPAVLLLLLTTMASPTTAQEADPFNCVNVTTNCSGHATNVSGGYLSPNGIPLCNCTCTNAWTGPACRNCPVGYNITDDCGSCEFGYIGYPNCTSDACTQADCNNHAKQVTGFRETGCNCTCFNAYQGRTCDFCPPRFFNGDGFCGSCALGYDSASYPNCYEECSIEFNCSDNANNVRGNVVEGCECDCIPGWTGTSDDQCSECMPNVVGSRCNRCASGYSNFPNCVQCTSQQNCSGRARTTQYDPDTNTCECIDCRNEWTGEGCQTCPIEFNAAADCGTCNTPQGFSGTYPNCDRECTNANACNNHARRVTGFFKTGCNCECDHEWTGGSCAICPERFDSRQNCAVCAPDRIQNTFPQCDPIPTTTPPPTSPPPSTTTEVSTTSAGPTSPGNTTMPPIMTTTTGPGGVTPPPPNETVAPTTGPNPAPTKSQEQPTPPPPPPSETDELTQSVSVSMSDNVSQSDSVSLNVTASESLELTDSFCPGSIADCLLFNNTNGSAPVNCECPCRNQWSTATCIFCEERYDSDLGDCGNCSLNHHFYPQCDYGMFLHGNYTPYWDDGVSSDGVSQSFIDGLLRADIMYALADDLTDFVRALTCNNASNVTGFVLSYDDDNDWFAFDIDILDPSQPVVNESAQCIRDALEVWWAVPANATRDLLDRLYPNQNVTVLLRNATMNLTNDNPCGDGWCRTGAAPIDEPPPDDSAFPFWVIILIIGLLMIIIGAALIYKRYRDVENAVMDRRGLKERFLDDDEAMFLSEEMSRQDVLTGGKVPVDSERAGSHVRRRANAPVVIPQNEI